MKIRVGTRGSRLALAQTHMVIDALREVDSKLEPEVIIIKTTGDKITDRSLDKIGDKGLFVKEIEEQLINGTIDIAVHSMKDMPFEMEKGLSLLPVLKREDPRDVLVTHHKIKSINGLPEKPVIGTGSKRRAVQLRSLIPEVNIVPIRGNVETRIRKMIEQMDGTVLAYAGIKRLNITDNKEITILPFSINEMIPAPAQGIIGCQFKSDQEDIHTLVNKITDKKTALQCKVERGFLGRVNGSCHLPMGAYLEYADYNRSNESVIEEEMVNVYGLFGDESLIKVYQKNIQCKEEEAYNTAIKIADLLTNEVNG